jgi:hypothetical protein
MWLCTLPSENRPSRWITPRPARSPSFAAATISRQACPAQIEPEAMASATSEAPCA